MAHIPQVIDPNPIKEAPQPPRVEAGSDRAIRAAHNMENTGGHFASHIARAYFHADRGNQRRLIEAFQHLFQDFDY